MNFTRITVDPNQMGGAPCIRGLRVPVTTMAMAMAEPQYVAPTVSTSGLC